MPSRPPRFPRALALALALAAALPTAACRRERTAPAEYHRFVDPPPGTLAPSYTLADETRPVLALPPQERASIPVPSGDAASVEVPLPADVGDGLVIASGAYQRAKRVFPMLPAEVRVGRGADGRPVGTLEVPPMARGSGPPSMLTLAITRPPADGTSTTRVGPVLVPPHATLHFGYGLAEAAALAGSAPVALELTAELEDGTRRPLWSTTVKPQPFLLRWADAAAALEEIGGRSVHLEFAAHAAGPGRPVVLPLWADPTIVAWAPRPPARRNVVLMSLDTLRGDRLGVAGSYRPTTPAIDAFAGKGVLFTNAWSPWPETSGAHMSLFTSRYPSEHGVTGFVHAPPPGLPLLAERLRRAGYLTRAFTEDGGVWAYAGFARGFSAYAERRSFDFVYRGEAAATFKDATRWLEANAHRQFFLFVHTYQVHAPYVPPKEYRTLFSDIPGREAPGMAGQALSYDRETRYTDDQVGPFLATLRRLGLDENTIVIVTADHGEEFGEHGGSGHGRTVFPEVLRVPLVVSAPDLLPPARSDAPVSLLDVVPTLLDLLDLEPDPSVRGQSLADAAAGATLAGRTLVAEVDRVDPTRIQQVAARRDGRAAILDVPTGAVRCYGPDDPGEQHPTEGCPDLAAAIEEHRRTSVRIGAAPSPQPTGAVDPRLIEKMRALGYVE